MAPVYALELPECAERYWEYAFSIGYFFVPIKRRCLPHVSLPVAIKIEDEGLALYCMGCPRKVFFVTEVPNINIHSRTGLVSISIVDKEHLELIGQPDNPI